MIGLPAGTKVWLACGREGRSEQDRRIILDANQWSMTHRAHSALLNTVDGFLPAADLHVVWSNLSWHRL